MLFIGGSAATCGAFRALSQFFLAALKKGF
jgi:hypothetical protein